MGAATGDGLEPGEGVVVPGRAHGAGTHWARPDLCEEALRLGRMLAALAPNEPEVHALAALMELHASRLPARIDASGAPVLLPAQDRTRWDRLLIHRGLTAVARAQLSGLTGPYLLQAQIAACHATAPTAQETTWVRIATLYDELAAVQPSPVVELNRAVAHAHAYGPQVGLALLDPLLTEKSMATYHLLPAVRAELLGRTGRWAEAAQEYDRAASLTANEVERTMMLARGDAAHANAPRTS